MSDNNSSDTEKIREYFKNFLNMYISTADKAGIPVNRSQLESIINDVKFKSDFSDNDIYSPLEPAVEKLLQSIGYKDIREFATDVLASNKGVVNSINEKNFEKLCQIGVICKGIYKENGFNNTLNVSK